MSFSNILIIMHLSVLRMYHRPSPAICMIFTQIESNAECFLVDTEQTIKYIKANP